MIFRGPRGAGKVKNRCISQFNAFRCTNDLTIEILHVPKQDHKRQHLPGSIVTAMPGLSLVALDTPSVSWTSIPSQWPTWCGQNFRPSCETQCCSESPTAQWDIAPVTERYGIDEDTLPAKNSQATRRTPCKLGSSA